MLETVTRRKTSSGAGVTFFAPPLEGVGKNESTAELLKTVQRADALSGNRGNVNLKASIAAGMQAAGKEGGASGIFGLGVAGNSFGISSLFQQVPSSEPNPTDTQDLVKTLEGLKRALDTGLITKDDFEAAKAKALGLL